MSPEVSESNNKLLYGKFALSGERSVHTFPETVNHNRIYLFGHDLENPSQNIFFTIRRDSIKPCGTPYSRESVLNFDEFRTKYLWKACRIVFDPGDTITLSCGLIDKDSFITLSNAEVNTLKNFKIDISYAMFRD